MARNNKRVAGVPPRLLGEVAHYLSNRDFEIGRDMPCPEPRHASKRGSVSCVRRKRCRNCNNFYYWNLSACPECGCKNYVPRRH